MRFWRSSATASLATLSIACATPRAESATAPADAPVAPSAAPQAEDPLRPRVAAALGCSDFSWEESLNDETQKREVVRAAGCDKKVVFKLKTDGSWVNGPVLMRKSDGGFMPEHVDANSGGVAR